MFTSGNYSSYFNWYTASIYRAFDYLKAAPTRAGGGMTATHYDIDFYLHPALAYGTFDANGDDVLEGLYHLVGSKTDQAGVSYSDAIGDQTFARPTWCADVTPSASP